ncbi:hypothetical protein UFOVP393_53 [uncultured Caudovirales phage]|uniref:Uncharacterized protein n=1 Tax=uncultured Caudovirales phage TaxID=2100421 RepID=A0A6J7X2D8_9CAUD|nr:hypothetical protein UFOVP393_53 [uncultured Caudovirales phage]
MKTVFSLHVPFGLRLDQSEGKGKLFRVTYGKQVKDQLTYTEGAREFGLCLFHALACDGLLDNEGDL